MEIPPEVIEALEKLDTSDQSKVETFIDKLKTTIVNLEEDIAKLKDPEGSAEKCSDAEAIPASDNPEGKTKEEDFPAMYESGEDFDAATNYKMEATDLKNDGNYAAALEKYTLAVQASPPSALLLANRADCLFRLKKFTAAVKDCDAALENNPDSAKALRIRGKSQKELGDYEKARADLSASQAIDYDDSTVEALKFVTDKMKEVEGEKVKQKLEEEAKKKKRAEEIRKAQEEARKEQEEEEKKAREASAGMGGMPGGMPGGMGGMPGGMGGMPGGMGGMPGGMGGMPGMGGMGGMADLFSDPEIAEGLKNPKVMEVLGGMMSGGGMPDMSKLSAAMADPEAGPVLQKMMSKLTGGMGGAGGMPGGMGGMPGMGGMGGMGAGGMPNMGDDDDDNDYEDIPDLE